MISDAAQQAALAQVLLLALRAWDAVAPTNPVARAKFAMLSACSILGSAEREEMRRRPIFRVRVRAQLPLLWVPIRWPPGARGGQQPIRQSVYSRGRIPLYRTLAERIGGHGRKAAKYLVQC